MSEYLDSSFSDVMNSFSDGLSQLFLPLSQFVRKKELKKVANDFVSSIIKEISSKDIRKIVQQDILANMPNGIWNIDTIELVEKKMNLFFNEEFVNSISTKFLSLNLSEKEKANFLKMYLISPIKNLVEMIRFLKKMISKSSLKEKDKLNLKLGREFVATLGYIENISIEIIKQMKHISPKFMKRLKKYWIAYTLLSLRILDIVLIFESNKKLANKKLDFLHYELIKARDFF